MLQPQEIQRPLSVSELAQQVRLQLRPLSAVLVKGEVTGMKQGAKGHYSFSIRDAGSVLQAFIWADTARRLPMLPEDGQEYVFRGRIDFWPQGGLLRLVVEHLEYDDVGKMRAQLERLKQRLELEGAFDSGRKRALPFLPKRIALITSPTGAVIHDLQETIWERFPNMEIAVYPAQVQGTASPGSVAAAIAACNRARDASVIIIARGGGSFEELYAFNTEVVARAILASRMPIVTALGHTSDRTVADMVADAECRTPTDAGARVVPRKSDLLAQLADRSRRVDREIDRLVATANEHVRLRSQSIGQLLPLLLQRRVDRLERARNELARLSPARQLERRREGLQQHAARLGRAEANVLRTRSAELSRRPAERAQRLIEERVRRAAVALQQRQQRLQALSPDAVLARGYSITQDEKTGAVLRASSETAAGRRIAVRLAHGKLGASVTDVRT
jgi:exodeoxyribonuclease VII large subunit